MRTGAYGLSYNVQKTIATIIIHSPRALVLVVIDGPFQTKSGVRIGVQAMTSCVTIIYACLKKRNISVLSEIMLFSNLWQYHFKIFHSLVDNVLANLIALTKRVVHEDGIHTSPLNL